MSGKYPTNPDTTLTHPPETALADLTANDFASAVYNIFLAALVFGAGWLLVQHMQMTHKLRDVEDEVERLNTRVVNLKEDLSPSDAPEPHASTSREGPR